MGIVIAHNRRRPFQAKLGKIQTWVARRIGATRHEHRVMQIAVAIFKLTQSLHGLEAKHRKILKVSALVHDVGRCRGSNKHHIKGARMLQETASLDLSRSELEAVAFLTRYHRGRVPESRQHLFAHPGNNTRTLRLLLAILRAADALDSRNLFTPAVALRFKDRQLRVRCYVTDRDKAAATFNRRKKFRLLENLLGLRIAVQLRQVDPNEIAW